MRWAPAGHGIVEFGDDPRMYEFLVEETFAPQGQGQGQD